MNAPLVCSTGPPGKRNGAVQTPIPNHLNSPRAYHGSGFVERGIWSSWVREGQRLFTEYWRTANAKHLSAFATHAHGMRMHDGRRK